MAYLCSTIVGTLASKTQMNGSVSNSWGLESSGTSLLNCLVLGLGQLKGWAPLELLAREPMKFYSMD